MSHNNSVDEAYQSELAHLHIGVDAVLVRLLPAQWLAAVVLAAFVAPRARQGVGSQTLPHLLLAAVLGGLLTLLPCWLAHRKPGASVTRVVLAIAQMGFSGLIIHLMAGRPEAHFHAFGSLALLALYRNQWVFVPAILVAALDHTLRGLWWPESIVGVSTPSFWRSFEHLAWMLFETSFLLLGVRQSQKQLRRAGLLRIEARKDRDRYAQMTAKLSNEFAEEQHLLDAIVNSVPNGLFWKDANSVYLGCNETFAKLAGLESPDEIIGLTDHDLPWTREQAEHYRNCDQEVVSRASSIRNLEETATDSDGQVCVMWTSKSPLLGFEGPPIGLVGSCVDVTEKLRAHEELSMLHQELADRQEMLEAVFDSAADAIIVIDTQGTIVRSNHSADRMLEGRGSLVGNKINDYMPREVSNVHHQLVSAAANQETRGQLLAARQIEPVRRDGTRFSGELTVSKVKHGDQILFAGIVRDVTERIQLQTQLAQASKLESIGGLAAGVAHEINTPMQFISSNVEFLRRQLDALLASMNLPADQCDHGLPAEVDRAEFQRIASEFDEALADCRLGVDRVVEIVSAMKDYAHPGGAEHEPVDVNQCLRDASVITRHQVGKAATLRLDLADCPQVVGSASALNQVFLNLLVNAVDAIEAVAQPGELGSIAISSRPIESGVEVLVSDSGCGMTPEVAARAFDPFYTTKDIGKGTGQGLAITYAAIVKDHGGAISVESNPGEGATFRVFLPYQGAGVPVAADRASLV